MSKDFQCFGYHSVIMRCTNEASFVGGWGEIKPLFQAGMEKRIEEFMFGGNRILKLSDWVFCKK